MSFTPAPSSKNTIGIGILLPENIRDEIKRIAAFRGVSASELIQMIIRGTHSAIKYSSLDRDIRYTVDLELPVLRLLQLKAKQRKLKPEEALPKIILGQK